MLLSRRVLARAVLAQLQTAAPLVNTYLGAVPTTPPADPDGRSHMYAVIYPAPGLTTLDRLATVVDGLVWSFQVTCVGGDPDRASAAVDAVTTALTGTRLTVPGLALGPLRELGDFGPAQEDRTATPSRWFTALTYQTHVTRST